MTLDWDKLGKVMAVMSAIGALVFMIHGYFATREALVRYEVKRIEADIDTKEALRDHYQEKIDDGLELNKYESRRLRTASWTLDNLYEEKEDAEDLLKSLER